MSIADDPTVQQALLAVEQDQQTLLTDLTAQDRATNALLAAQQVKNTADAAVQTDGQHLFTDVQSLYDAIRMVTGIDPVTPLPLPPSPPVPANRSMRD